MRISDWSSDVCFRSVITRAGATTAADLLTVGRPANFVPIPHGGPREEQRRNADTLAEAGVGWCAPAPGFTVEQLPAPLGELLASPIKRPQPEAVERALVGQRAAAELAALVAGSRGGWQDAKTTR